MKEETISKIAFILATIAALSIIVSIQLFNNETWWVIVLAPIIAIPLAYLIFCKFLKKSWLGTL